MNEIFKDFTRSIERFGEIIVAPQTVANRDSAIKRFELTFEPSWKTTQRFLNDQGIICRSPRECFKELVRFGALDDDAAWIEMMEDRNRTVHTYHEETADKIYSRLPAYLQLFLKLKDALGGL